VVVVTVRVDEPLPATEAGLKAAAAPAGNPLTLNPTLSLKPLIGLTVIV
jgi:hypothetical protein